MKRFISLEDLDDTTVDRLLLGALALEREPVSETLRGRVLGLLFLNPSLRTLASFQAGMAQLGGSSFVIAPGQGSWALELAPGVVMDGDRAEHIREAIPVLESYCDALGVRVFAAGESLEQDLRDPVLSEIDALLDKPLINLESAVDHPCQALADWKTLDDAEIPREGGKLVLSWAWHPKPLPLAVPSAVVTMAARRGMDVTVLRPDGYALPGDITARARQAAAHSGGRVEETDDIAAAVEGAHVIYAKSWGAPCAVGDPAAEAELRQGLRDWCVREDWFRTARPRAKFLHCLPVRRNVVVADEVLDGPRSLVRRQAANRLHVQKAVLVEMLGGSDPCTNP